MIPKSLKRVQTHICYFILLSMISCSQNKNDARLINELEKNLNKSIETVVYSTNMWMERLKDKIRDPASKSQAEFWFDKADSVNKLTQDLSVIIQQLEVQGFTKKITPNQLVDRILSYKTKILNTIDENMEKSILDQLDYNRVPVSFIRGDSLTIAKSIKRAKKSNRLNQNLALLDAIIKMNQNKIISFCALKADWIRDEYYTYSAIIAQNSKCFLPGDEIEIKAGVGAFSSSAQPTILINKQAYKINENGYVHYKSKTPTQPGSYTIPVLIRYFDQSSGNDVERLVDVKYTVMKECKE